MTKSPFDSLGDAELRRTLLFVRAGRKPATAADVAEGLSVARTVARWRLERLATAGLLHTAFEQRPAGRPAKTYRAAPETEQIEFPPRRYERLVSLLMRRRGKGDLRRVGMEFGQELASQAGLNVDGGLEGLCRGLGKLGFQASVGSVDGERAEIVSATCPLRPVVVSDPAAREIDEGMWIGLVDAAVGSAQAECRTHDCFGRGRPCRIEIRFR